MSDLWLGQAKVTPRSGNDSLEGDAGAFVNVVCQAASDEYDQRVDAAKLSAAEVWAFVLEREREAHVFAAAQIGSDRKRQQDFMDRELELRSKAGTDPLARSPEQMWANAVALATSMLLCFPGTGPGAPHLDAHITANMLTGGAYPWDE